MIAFVLTLLYTALTLLSPAVLPQELVSLHMAEILGGLTIVATLFSLSEVGLFSVPDTYLAVGLTFAVVLSTLATGWIGGAMETLLGFLPVIFNFFFIVVSCRSVKRIRVLTFVLLLVAFFIIAQGVVAYETNNLTSPYLETENITQSVLYRHRGLGVLNDPNDLAQFLVMLLPLLWLRWKKGAFGGNLFFTLFPACVLLTGIFLTHSRGGIIAVVAVLLFGFKDKLGLVKSAILTGLALLGTVALDVSGGRGLNDDDGGRVAAWVTGLEVFKSHPLLGVGVGNFPQYNSTGLTAHNSYVLCLAESGMIGYFFWMGMIVSGWTGLSMVLAGETKEPAPEKEEEAWEPWHPGASTLRTGRASVNGPWEGGRGVALEQAKDDDKKIELEDDKDEEEQEQERESVHAAKILRVSLVGLLTASFFLSRTYSMTLYVLFGMAVALRMVSKLPLEQDTGRLAKKICGVMAGSVIFLYLFVRVRGVR